ncbi:hypothetical protein [Piscinibacter sakaiensis]|uniref:PNPLA domain-containing protein n=1 Tax=Piscinibacter sakaiensis TaxID=1547922 RepID=A0A0K8P3L6_PISS1|nr:hypothetical protein [Piscinibacter sakaiensis]GAP37227.1 hypothetical protein ISF6_3082 [Piscinibacter sakaiensis]
MPALRLYAGPAARALLAREGLRPQHVHTLPGAAGGPKGLILGPLDRYLFGHWLATATQPVDLVGASIGAWRLATACTREPVAGLQRLEHDYIRQHYPLPPGQKRLSARQVSQSFADSLDLAFDGRIAEVLAHPRYRLHIVTSRGRHLLGREGGARTALGYLGALASNGLHRRALGAWLERCVFSSGDGRLPFDTRDFPTRRIPLTAENFKPALQASCSIPFVLEAVHDIPGAPPGAHWDGGITDYHLHLDYRGRDGLVLYPHFQRAVVPGWLDKPLRWRHRATPFLDAMLLLAPDPAWVATLPGGKLPDRGDFQAFQHDPAARSARWARAVGEAQRLADEFAEWVAGGADPARVEPLG